MICSRWHCKANTFCSVQAPCLNTAWNCPTILLRGWFTWKSWFYPVHYRSPTISRRTKLKSLQCEIGWDFFYEFEAIQTSAEQNLRTERLKKHDHNHVQHNNTCISGSGIFRNSLKFNFIKKILQIFNTGSNVSSRHALCCGRLLVWMSAGVWLKG